jgi:CheY-like chemotaxis protein
MTGRTLAGRRVLVVEDEYFLAFELDNDLRAAGAIVLGPAPSVDMALDLLEREMPELAVLDVNLGGEMADPVTDALLARGVPVLITTGYDLAALPERFATVRRLQKLVETSTIVRELGRLLGGAV